MLYEVITSFTVASIANLGKHQFKVISTKTDGIEGVSFQNFEIFSRLTPELYSFEIVHTYPHSTDHFTQGLEVHNNRITSYNVCYTKLLRLLLRKPKEPLQAMQNILTV